MTRSRCPISPVTGIKPEYEKDVWGSRSSSARRCDPSKNSSSYPTSQLIDAVSRPGRVANTHYYGGLPEVNVVEVMSCGKTTDEVIARLLERLPAYGLLHFHVLKESVGFIFNRIWAPRQ